MDRIIRQDKDIEAGIAQDVRCNRPVANNVLNRPVGKVFAQPFKGCSSELKSLHIIVFFDADSNVLPAGF